MIARADILRSGGLCLLLAATLASMDPLFADCQPDAQERQADFPSADRIRALSSNGRTICKALVYLERDRIDTGYSVEPALAFRDSAGRRFWLLGRSIAQEDRFLPRRTYGLRLRFVGQTKEGVPVAEKKAEIRRPYEGDIRESDPRLVELKEKLLRGEALPAALRLRYGGTRADFAVFYDLMGRQIFYRYREDRFDRRSERKLTGLIPGQAYLVEGRYVGARRDAVVLPPASPEYRAALAQPDTSLEYEFLGATPLRMEQILFR